MVDVYTSKKRSEIMGAIRAKHTKPEVIVRLLFRSMGCRYRLHVKSLPGKPDIVIPDIRLAVQVRGCFWHGHRCLKGRIPAANRVYWEPKILGNKRRDARNDRRLRRMGWSVKIIWECQVRRSSAEGLLARLVIQTDPTDSRPNAGAVAMELGKIERMLASIKRR
jgi:DNA mismatch endonuclease (patch repair protein)